MERLAALVLSLLFLFAFTVIMYYGCYVTLYSSVVFGIFVSLILLCILYPVSGAVADEPDFSLFLYAIYIIVGIIILGIYIIQKCFCDVRGDYVYNRFNMNICENIEVCEI